MVQGVTTQGVAGLLFCCEPITPEYVNEGVIGLCCNSFASTT
jgi:hypothetical protein